MGRIMVVDDEPDMRLAVRLLLERNGHTVEEVASGEDACQRVQGAPPDLLLMDIRMPGQDGLETLEKIRQSNKTMPVIIMTGYGNPETEKEAFRKGATDYILKPFRNEDLMEAISHVGLPERHVTAAPMPERRTVRPPTALRRVIPAVHHFWYVVRQAKAIFLDRWRNPPIQFERDPSFEERISLRLSLITDPFMVLYHGFFDDDFEFPLIEEAEKLEHHDVAPVDDRRDFQEKTMRPSYPVPIENEGENLRQDLSRQIQSVAQSLQADIGRLADQMHQRQAPAQAAPPQAPAPQGLRESPQEEYHRLLIELQTAWDQRLSAIGKELSSDQEVIGQWTKTLPDLRRAVDRS